MRARLPILCVLLSGCSERVPEETPHTETRGAQRGDQGPQKSIYRQNYERILNTLTKELTAKDAVFKELKCLLPFRSQEFYIGTDYKQKIVNKTQGSTSAYLEGAEGALRPYGYMFLEPGCKRDRGEVANDYGPLIETRAVLDSMSAADRAELILPVFLQFRSNPPLPGICQVVGYISELPHGTLPPWTFPAAKKCALEVVDIVARLDALGFRITNTDEWEIIIGYGENRKCVLDMRITTLSEKNGSVIGSLAAGLRMFTAVPSSRELIQSLLADLARVEKEVDLDYVRKRIREFT